MEQRTQKSEGSKTAAAGLGGWVLERLRRSGRTQPRLALVERIALAPKQSLALVEAEGRRFLVATSAEGTPVFYPLDSEGPAEGQIRSRRLRPVHPARLSW
jgi:flagellar biogenesis protein FliO